MFIVALATLRSFAGAKPVKQVSLRQFCLQGVWRLL